MGKLKDDPNVSRLLFLILADQSELRKHVIVYTYEHLRGIVITVVLVPGLPENQVSPLPVIFGVTIDLLYLVDVKSSVSCKRVTVRYIDVPSKNISSPSIGSILTVIIYGIICYLVVYEVTNAMRCFLFFVLFFLRAESSKNRAISIIKEE